MRLRHSIAAFQIGGHLERVNLGVWLLTECEQFPHSDTERPLQQRRFVRTVTVHIACKLLETSRNEDICTETRQRLVVSANLLVTQTILQSINRKKKQLSFAFGPYEITKGIGIN